LALSVAPEFSLYLETTPEAAVISILNVEFGVDMIDLFLKGSIALDKASDLKNTYQKQQKNQKR
jgi:hypothetical protein